MGSPARNPQGLAKKFAKMQKEDLEDLLLKMHDENIHLKTTLKSEKENIKLMSTRLNKRGSSNATNLSGRDAKLAEKLEAAEATIVKLESEKETLKRKLQLMRVQGTEKPARGAYSHVGSKVTGRRPIAIVEKQEKQALKALAEKEEELLAFQESAQTEIQKFEDQIKHLHQQLTETQEVLNTERAQSRKELSRARKTLAKKDEELRSQKASMEANDVDAKKKAIVENVNVVRLNRTLKESENEITGLKAKLDLSTQTIAELNEANAIKAKKLEDLSTTLATERARVQTLVMEAGAAAKVPRGGQADLVAELQEENKILRAANDKITEAAFSGERRKQHEQQLKLFKDKIMGLENHARAELKEKSELQMSLSQEQHTRTKMQTDLREAERKLMTLTSERDNLVERMKFFTSESGDDIAEMEEALQLIRTRKAENGNSTESNDLDFLEKTKKAEEEKETQKKLQKRLKDMTVSHAETINELGKTRLLLQTQESLSQQLQARISELETRKEGIERAHSLKLKEYDDLVQARNERIQSLERRLRDIAYGTNQTVLRGIPMRGVDDQDGIPDPEVNPGENVLEICVSRAELTPEAIAVFRGAEPSTFITFDFYEFETEHTVIRYGAFPRYDSVSQFILEVDEAFVAYLRKNTMTMELHQTVDVNYKTLAAGQVRLTELLSDSEYGAKKKILGKIELVSLENPAVVFARVDYWMRLQLPIGRSLRHAAERKKAIEFLKQEQEEQQMEVNVAPKVVPGDMKLRVEIVAAEGVSSRMSGGIPSCYVAFKFLDLEDQTTKTIIATQSPQFNEARILEMDASEELHDYLMHGELQVFVIDDSDDDVESFLGVARIPLHSLLDEQQQIASWFDLVMPNGKTNGKLAVELSWLTPYVTPPGVDVRQAKDIILEENKTNDSELQDVPQINEESYMEPPTEDYTGEAFEGDSDEITEDVVEENIVATSAADKEDQLSEQVQAQEALQEPVQNDEEVVQEQQIDSNSQEVISKSQATPEKAKPPSKEEKKKTYIPPAFVGVDGLLFNKGSRVAQDKNVQRLFVSFTFLEVDEERLESPDSLLKPAPEERLDFNHRVQFHFDNSPELHEYMISTPSLPRALRALAKQIQTHKSAILSFEVVHDPTEDQGDAQCHQVGFSFVELAELWAQGKNLSNEGIPLYDYDAWYSERRESVVIGTLFVTVEIVNSLLALAKKKKKTK
eukprot:m.9530 g.9530  ORF g.9530 m.9530 type:complete len:1205 (+) comp4078_c0_seq2:221-3835(+)